MWTWVCVWMALGQQTETRGSIYFVISGSRLIVLSNLRFRGGRVSALDLINGGGRQTSVCPASHIIHSSGGEQWGPQCAGGRPVHASRQGFWAAKSSGIHQLCPCGLVPVDVAISRPHFGSEVTHGMRSEQQRQRWSCPCCDHVSD